MVVVSVAVLSLQLKGVNVDGILGYHGRGKPFVKRETFWTHRPRRGAFGHELWKKWFNNRAMNKYEARLREPRARNGLKRYDMRKLAPLNVDTRVDRDCV